MDRYSNWPIVERTSGGAQGLINSLRRSFVTYGIPEELASDGGPEFVASNTKTFLKTWGVHHRLSSVAFPHSNCRAEIGVKTMKRLLVDNTGPNGELDTDKVQRAVLQYRNAPDPTTKISPAMCLFGRPIRDFIPIFPGRYEPHSTWKETLEAREEALRVRHMRTSERLSEHTKRLPQLKVGDHVRIQNQTGPHPLKWDKTGKIIEVRQFDQYAARVDGSGRVTLRNRKFLRKCEPVATRETQRDIQEDMKSLPKIIPLPPLKNDLTPSVPMPKVIPTVQEDPTTSPEEIIVDNTPPLTPSPPTPILPNTTAQPSNNDDLAPIKKPESRALIRLFSHNNPGVKEIIKATPETNETTLRRSSRNK